MTAREQAQACVPCAWGDREGLACLAIGFGPHHDANGKYKHRRFRARFPPLARPRRRRCSTGRWSMRHTRDVYVTPLLRSSCARTKDNALPGRTVWADIDPDQLTLEINGFDRLLDRAEGDAGRPRSRPSHLPAPAWDA